MAGRGADDLLAISRRLKAAGEKELRKEFHKGLQTAAKPLIPKVREAARRDLPKHGGLNERIARKPMRAQVRTGAKTAGVRIVGTKVDPRINQGRVYHPVFGRQGRAVNGGKNSVVQTVESAKGYFDETLTSNGSAIQDEVTAVMRDWTLRILRERI
jgi:hypothetical protein